MDLFIKIIVCFIAGAGAGLGTGFAGMSAAAVIGPMLTAFLKVPAYQAVGIGLASDVLASAISAATYAKHKNLDIKNSLPLIISVLCATATGSYVAQYLPDRAMSSTMQISMILIGLRFILKPVKTEKSHLQSLPNKERIIKSVIGGIVVGSICGVIGAGGGMMLLFVLTSFLGYELHMAVGTSVFIMTFTAFTGGISHMVIGGVPDIICLLLCVAFTLIWARIAAKIANKAKTVTLNRVVGCILIVSAVVILAVNCIK